MDDYEVVKKYMNLRNSAVARGIMFDLNFVSVKNLLKAKKCYYTGVKLNDVPGHPHQRTVDRVDNSKGYVKGNVVACANYFNGKKGDLAVEEIKLLARKV